MVAAFKKNQPSLMSSPNHNGEVDETWVSGPFKDETPGGMAPPLTFTAGKANLTDCWFWMTTAHGKCTEKYGLKPECATKS